MNHASIDWVFYKEEIERLNALGEEADRKWKVLVVVMRVFFKFKAMAEKAKERYYEPGGPWATSAGVRFAELAAHAEKNNETNV